MAVKRVYRVFFSSQGKGYELYAGKVGQADLYGFVQVENILFGERSSTIVDPSEEQLKNEFSSVKRLLIPFHAVHRIDEVEREGKGKIISLAAGESGGAIPLSPPAPGPTKR